MKAKGFISEFRDFISRGNVMDMAVGVLIGGSKFSFNGTHYFPDVKGAECLAVKSCKISAFGKRKRRAANCADSEDMPILPDGDSSGSSQMWTLYFTTGTRTGSITAAGCHRIGWNKLHHSAITTAKDISNLRRKEIVFRNLVVHAFRYDKRQIAKM